jgi:hypothetical protein
MLTALGVICFAVLGLLVAIGAGVLYCTSKTIKYFDGEQDPPNGSANEGDSCHRSQVAALVRGAGPG